MLIDLFLQPGYQWPPLLEAPSPLPSPEDGGLQRYVREERDVTSEPSEGQGDDTSRTWPFAAATSAGKTGKVRPGRLGGWPRIRTRLGPGAPPFSRSFFALACEAVSGRLAPAAGSFRRVDGDLGIFCTGACRRKDLKRGVCECDRERERERERGRRGGGQAAQSGVRKAPSLLGPCATETDPQTAQIRCLCHDRPNRGCGKGPAGGSVRSSTTLREPGLGPGPAAASGTHRAHRALGTFLGLTLPVAGTARESSISCLTTVRAAGRLRHDQAR